MRDSLIDNIPGMSEETTGEMPRLFTWFSELFDIPLWAGILIGFILICIVGMIISGSGLPKGVGGKSTKSGNGESTGNTGGGAGGTVLGSEAPQNVVEESIDLTESIQSSGDDRSRERDRERYRRSLTNRVLRTDADLDNDS